MFVYFLSMLGFASHCNYLLRCAT